MLVPGAQHAYSITLYVTKWSPEGKNFWWIFSNLKLLEDASVLCIETLDDQQFLNIKTKLEVCINNHRFKKLLITCWILKTSRNEKKNCLTSSYFLKKAQERVIFSQLHDYLMILSIVVVELYMTEWLNNSNNYTRYKIEKNRDAVFS